MSRDLYFYKVSRIVEKLPEVIDIDETPIDYVYAYDRDALEWEKEIGQKCIIKQKEIKWFEAAKDLLGKQPKSIRYRSDETYPCYDEKGQCIGVITSKMLEPYYYTAERISYVYNREYLATSSSVYIVESARDGIITFDELFQWAEEVIQYIDENDEGECFDYAGKMLFAVIKAAIYAKNGDMILCDIG
ncbi:MAG: hypothetical protein J6E46_13065 [Faecalicoccus sp.]|nr:hypothetical protein [Faecalicoccus sp.]